MKWSCSRRWAGRRGAASVVLGAAVTLGACAQSNGRGLAYQACKKVRQSIHLVHEAASQPPAKARSLRYRAVLDLQAAEPLAAVAAGEDTEWDALQATLEEAGQIPESHLISALSAQCASPVGDG